MLAHACGDDGFTLGLLIQHLGDTKAVVVVVVVMIMVVVMHEGSSSKQQAGGVTNVKPLGAKNTQHALGFAFEGEMRGGRTNSSSSNISDTHSQQS